MFITASPAPNAHVLDIVAGTIRSVTTARTAAAAALVGGLAVRASAMAFSHSSVPLLVALLTVSLLSFFVAASTPPVGAVDQRVMNLCKRASVVQSVVGAVALMLALA